MRRRSATTARDLHRDYANSVAVRGFQESSGASEQVLTFSEFHPFLFFQVSIRTVFSAAQPPTARSRLFCRSKTAPAASPELDRCRNSSPVRKRRQSRESDDA